MRLTECIKIISLSFGLNTNKFEQGKVKI